ncbi:GNAT family N-acetyltransferase [Gordonia zhaorongruii]|uniref:GNAT family N-acetyltransferase n=1 Tax=Gordonia zhaorongruii TaxID=2597659 RepID=UPI0010439ABF|nr:GNAT family N-acetyltransferase [Gordonia zhaorongruii]
MTQRTPVPPPTVQLEHEPELRHNPDRDRYELWSGEELIGVAGYETNDSGDLILLHTVVTERFARAGFARLLVATLLDTIESEGRHVVPVCTYTQSFIERFPQYRDVVADYWEQQH